MPKPEAFSRVLIDQELRESGWDLLDERRVRFELDGHSGRADYVLSGERGPLCVLEAKRPDLDPYDAFGRVHTVSNPHRTATATTDGTTTYAYDALGRIAQVTLQDGSPVKTSYSGNTTTVKDPAGKSRKSVSDAFGRLTQVVEDPGGLGYVTTYAYDALSNLTSVVQNGSRQRTFVYDSLSRLTSATNPESGTITYAYDNNSNLHTKTAPAPNQTGTATVTTTFTYDALNRKTYESFSDGTYRGGFSYDQTTSGFGNAVSNPFGRLTTAWEAYGGKDFSYDPMGRVILAREAVNSTVVNAIHSTAYAYDLAGDVTSIQYPSGRTVTYGHNSAAQVTSLTDSNGSQYATNLTYWPNGAQYQWWSPRIYSRSDQNNRLQPVVFYADNGVTTGYYMNRSYGYNAGQNNGNVISITDSRDNTRGQNFGYDALNRLTSAQTQTSGITIPNSNCWGLTFGYDAWGNLLSSTSSGPSGCAEPLPLNLSATTKNQISGYCYDAAGNLLDQGVCPTTGVHSYTYDAGNMLKTFGSYTYLYDFSGQRFQKWQNGAGVKGYWYGMNSDPISEGDVNGNITQEYIFLNGKRIAATGGTIMPNKGFEQGMTDWLPDAGPSIVTDVTRAHSGNNYLQISTSTGAEATNLQFVPVAPGDIVTFGGWAYRESGTTGVARWKLVTYDVNQNIITYPSPSPTDVSTAAWTLQKGSYVIPSGTAFVRLYAEIYQPTAATVARFDDGFLTLSTVPLFYLADHLGSSRLVTDTLGNILDDTDFYPFGGERPVVSASGNTHKFTGKERDSESGLDNFGARYDSSSLGRFMSPDPLGGKLADPQTLNKYSYVRNNPVTLTDPTGLYTINCTDDVKNCNKQEQNFDKALQNASKSKDASVRDAAAAYGPLSKQAGDAGDNGVNVSLTKTVDAQHPDVTGQTTSQPGTGGLTYNAATNTFQQATQVTIKAGLGSDTLEETAVHEGVHVEDRAAFVNSLGLDLKTGAITMNNSLNITARQSEINAYGVENIFLQSMGLPQRNVQDILLHPPYSDNPNINKPLFQALPGGPPR